MLVDEESQTFCRRSKVDFVEILCFGEIKFQNSLNKQHYYFYSIFSNVLHFLFLDDNFALSETGFKRLLYTLGIFNIW